jgi:hypothetical protein
MPKPAAPSSVDLLEMDRFYREGGLRQMASPRIHYHDSNCPHPGCARKLEWIDFQLYGDPEGIYKPLVRAWWDGTGFVGQCPSCNGWIQFTTLRMAAVSDDEAQGLPQLPTNWHSVAQIA